MENVEIGFCMVVNKTIYCRMNESIFIWQRARKKGKRNVMKRKLLVKNELNFATINSLRYLNITNSSEN